MLKSSPFARPSFSSSPYSVFSPFLHRLPFSHSFSPSSPSSLTSYFCPHLSSSLPSSFSPLISFSPFSSPFFPTPHLLPSCLALTNWLPYGVEQGCARRDRAKSFCASLLPTLLRRTRPSHATQCGEIFAICLAGLHRAVLSRAGHRCTVLGCGSKLLCKELS